MKYPQMGLFLGIGLFLSVATAQEIRPLQFDGVLNPLASKIHFQNTKQRKKQNINKALMIHLTRSQVRQYMRSEAPGEAPPKSVWQQFKQLFKKDYHKRMKLQEVKYGFMGKEGFLLYLDDEEDILEGHVYNEGPNKTLYGGSFILFSDRFKIGGDVEISRRAIVIDHRQRSKLVRQKVRPGVQMNGHVKQKLFVYYSRLNHDYDVLLEPFSLGVGFDFEFQNRAKLEMGWTFGTIVDGRLTPDRKGVILDYYPFPSTQIQLKF